MVESSEILDVTYASLAHPVRRAMLHRLRRGEARVTELAYPFEISLAAASKHVGQLERAGLVSRRVAGREHWISIAPARLGEAAGWLAAYRAFWEQRLAALETLVTEPTDG